MFLSRLPFVLSGLAEGKEEEDEEPNLLFESLADGGGGERESQDLFELPPPPPPPPVADLLPPRVAERKQRKTVRIGGFRVGLLIEIGDIICVYASLFF